MEKMIPASQRAVSTPAKPLNPVLEPLLKASFNKTLTLLQRVFPQSAQGLRGTRDSDPVGSLYIELMHGDDAKPSNSIGAIHKKSNPQGFLKTSRYRNAMRQPTCCRPRLLLSGRPGSGHCAHLAQSVLHALEKLTVHTLDLPRLLGVGRALPEEACAQVFSEAKKTSPSILYLPNIQKWWDTVSATLKSTFLSLLQDIPSFSPILLLVTSDFPHEDLDEELQNLFCVEYGEVFSVPEPSQVERMKFFEDLILHQAATAPLSQRKSLLQSKEVLPLAPPSPPRQLSESEVLRLEEREEHTLRELRLVLRRVTERLALDRRFKAFCKPVDTEEVTALPMPDYCTVIKQPMDLSTLLTNIDMHKYITVNEFLNDVDLIWKNALEYKPDCDHTDRQIRHQACALKDTVRSIIKQELDKDLEKICEKIRESRNTRGFTSSRLAPWFCEVKEEGHRTEKLKQSQAFLSTRSTRKRKCVQQRPRKAKIRAQEQPLPKETPALIVDHEKLRGLLQHVVQRTESWEVIKLEKLYAYLAQCIYKHHQDYDKTSLIQNCSVPGRGPAGGAVSFRIMSGIQVQSAFPECAALRSRC
ncbi:ATPase family AAA domain-containing protein 2-like [Hoplias malabaricus]|uniref:ATPase family AAA domain-containing protein 2-like n=1 Tax=Hoplias malabaricus TaxID=27720 RepID=UPI003461BC30